MRTNITIDINLVGKLYLEERKSVPEMAKLLNTSTHIIYSLMSKNNILRRTPAELNALRFHNKKPSFNLKRYLSLKDRELKVIGTMLYWGEGFQSAAATGVDFANSSPQMIVLFLRFLRQVCGIDELKLRVYLYCYSNQNPGELIDFWSNITHIPESQFTKPYVRYDFDPAKLNKMKHGLIHIRYYDKKLLQSIRDWIQEYVQRYTVSK